MKRVHRRHLRDESQCHALRASRARRATSLLLQDFGQQQRLLARAIQHIDRHAVAAQRGQRLRDRRVAARPVGAHQRDVALARTPRARSASFSTSRLFTWQVTHHAAVKSTNTGRPAARSSATRGGVNGCHAASVAATRRARRRVRASHRRATAAMRPRRRRPARRAAATPNARRAAAAERAPRPQRERDDDQRRRAGAPPRRCRPARPAPTRATRPSRTAETRAAA